MYSRSPLTSKLREEAAILYDLRHTNIIQFSGVLWSPPDFAIAMPFMKFGSIETLIDEYDINPSIKVGNCYYSCQAAEKSYIL